MISNEELESILELAGKAITKPAWRHGKYTEETNGKWMVFCDEMECAPVLHVEFEEDAAFIASVSPDRITEIVKELIELRDYKARIEAYELQPGKRWPY